MRDLKSGYTSPILLSLLHFLPSVLLIAMVAIAVVGLGIGEKRVVLGAQSTWPQIRTLTIEDRIKELSGFANKIKSESIVKATEKLTR